MVEQFLVLCGQIVGNMQAGFEVIYGWDGETHDDRKKAIASGLKSRGSDDFSIGVIRDGRLASLDWMDKPKDEEPGTLRDIEDQIGWEDPRNTFAVQQEADALQQGGDETDFEWVRRLRAHFTDATSLAEAGARGRRQGLEEAAKVADQNTAALFTMYGASTWRARECERLSRVFRSLATTTAETQKPETGESAGLDRP